MNIKGLTKFFITPLIFSLNIYPYVFSKEQTINEDYKSTNQVTSLEKYKISPEYILGPGDQISIKFIGIDNFTNIFIVDNQGFINLPEINLQKAENYTLSELKEILLLKYNEFIYDPQIEVKLYKERPLKVTLRGEVNTSGLFVFNPKHIAEDKQKKDDLQLSLNISEKKNIYSFTIRPTLFDLIQKGNGLTSNADLSRIIIFRNNSLSGGGGKLKTEINLFNLIDKGDQSVNLELRDGDDILVSRSEEILVDQLSALNNSNLTPGEIGIFINGNVLKSGKMSLPQGISLFEAIAAAGEKSLSGNIEFIRLKKRGKTEKRIIAFNDKSIKGSTKNPILLSGDIIFVRKNILGQTTQAISEFSSPIIKSYGLYKILD